MYVFKSWISNFQKSCKIKTRILIDPSPTSPSCYFLAFASFFSPHQLPAFPPLYVLLIFQPLISASLMMTSVSLSLWRKPLHPSSLIVGFLPQQGAFLGSPLYLDKYGFMNSYFIQRTIFLSLISLMLRLYPICLICQIWIQEHRYKSQLSFWQTHHFTSPILLFLAQKDMPGLFCTFLASALELTIYPKNFGLF